MIFWEEYFQVFVSVSESFLLKADGIRKQRTIIGKIKVFTTSSWFFLIQYIAAIAMYQLT
jgi:hypothetical protein